MDNFIGWRIVENVGDWRIGITRIIGVSGLKKERNCYRIKRQVRSRVDG